MMFQSDNASTSMLIDHPTLGLDTFSPDLNDWVSAIPGVGRGFGILTSIQDLDRTIMWLAQYPNSLDQPSYFTAPRAGLETVFRGGSLAYWQCQDSSGDWIPGKRCNGPNSCTTSCSSGESCQRRSDPWGDMAAYMMSQDASWMPGDAFPSRDFTVGFPRYYRTSLNWATPRAFGALQEQFVTEQLLDETNTQAALDVMTRNNAPLQQSIPTHIEPYSKGGSKNGVLAPCSDTTIFKVGPDAVVLNVHSKDNLRPCNTCPAGNPGCTPVRTFWQTPPTSSGNPLGQVVLRRMLPDLFVASPLVASFSATTIRPGQPFEILGDVINTGGVAATFPVDFVLSSDTLIGDADDQILATVQASAAAGETVRARFSGAFPSIGTGTYWVGFVVDPPRPSAVPPLPIGAVGEYTENFDSAYLGVDARLTVLLPPPPCEDLDLDGFYDCSRDCDPTGLTCGDCRDDDPAVRPTATEVCNQIDDDCDGAVDPGASIPGTLKVVADPTPRTRTSSVTRSPCSRISTETGSRSSRWGNTAGTRPPARTPARCASTTAPLAISTAWCTTPSVASRTSSALPLPAWKT